MSLILAVEPDRRQARHLSAAVRQHVRGELVVAESGAAALKALGGRVPDLILTPALLPPKDEAVLTGWLRDMGDAAAHVQTLAIPILADPAASTGKEQNSSSIFGRLREQQQADAGPGCDPRVFADQVKVYLERAGLERSTRVPSEPEPIIEPVVAAAEDSTPELEDFDDAMTFDDLVFDPSPASEPAPSPAPVPVAEPPVAMKTRPFARPEKRVDPTVLQTWESELGLDSSASASAPPLWRISDPVSRDGTVPAAQRSHTDGFDPGDSRYSPLFRRLDNLAAQHA